MPHKQSAVNKDMTVLDVVSRYRETEAVFHAYDARAGECICCRALFDRLEDVSARYNLDIDEFLNDLESAIIRHADDKTPLKELL